LPWAPFARAVLLSNITGHLRWRPQKAALAPYFRQS